MIRFISWGIVRGEAWFNEPVSRPSPDVLIVRHAGAPPGIGGFEIKRSLVTDLTQTQEAIWDSIKRGCRREIRRAEEAAPTIVRAHAVSCDEEIIEFARFYGRFAAERDLPGVDIGYLTAIKQAGRLWISSISNESGTLASNCHIATGSTVRCLYGASIIKGVCAEQRKTAGHAHRLLDWTDMLAFKEAGFSLYDWGGLFIDESRPEAKRINDFKRQLGGKEVSYYEFVRPMSFLGRLYLALIPPVRAAFRRRRNMKASCSSTVVGSGSEFAEFDMATAWIV